jgi:hypothetical protein
VMSEYLDLRAQALSAPRSVTFKGVVLQVSEDHPYRQNGLLALNPCVCVTEPCPCDGYDHGDGQEVVWYASSDVIATRDTGRRTTQGDNLVEIDLSPSSVVFVESVRRTTALSYAANDRGGAATANMQ